MNLIHPTIPTWVASFGPKPQEIDKLLPLAMGTPGIKGLCYGVASSSIADGSYEADLKRVLGFLLPGQSFRIGISCQPLLSTWPSLSITIPVLHNPPAPHTIAKCWDPAIPELFLSDHQQVFDWICANGFQSQFQGWSLGGFGSVIGDSELDPFPGSGHQPQVYLASGETAADLEEGVVGKMSDIAFGLDDMSPGLQQVLSIVDPQHAAFSHKKDDGAFYTSVYKAAAKEFSSPLAVMWESMEQTIPPFLLSLGAPLFLQDKQGSLWMGAPPQGANVLMIQRHITDWEEGFTPQ